MDVRRSGNGGCGAEGRRAVSRIAISRDAATALLYHLKEYGHAAGTPCGRARQEIERELRLTDWAPPSIADMDRAGVPESERPPRIRRIGR